MIRVGDYRTTPDDEQVVLEVLRSNRLSEGPKVREFEEKWADFCGTKYCVLTNSGTSALIAALEVSKIILTGREVLTSPLTFVATINAIRLTGFEPTFADVNRNSFVIEPTINSSYIFIPVHLFGYPVDVENFDYFWMVEDACEAHGSIYKGDKVGSIGGMGCFSFYIAHNIQIGEMGAVVTDSADAQMFLRQIKAHGRYCSCSVCRRLEGKCPYKDKPYDPRFTHNGVGYNFKTTEIQAALALNQLRYADEIIEKRRANVKYLNSGLGGLPLQLPPYDERVSYLAYPLVLTNPEINRRDFCNKLESRGVETRPLFSCVPTQQPAYTDIKERWEGRLPNAEWLGSRGFYIGVHQYLEKEDLDYMIEQIRGCFD